MKFYNFNKIDEKINAQNLKNKIILLNKKMIAFILS
jgi:hypothetical protein